MRSFQTFLTTWILALLHLNAVGAADKPNFIVILTDDQSWVGSSVQIKPSDPRTRSDFYQTPHIERLAKLGMRFTQGYSPAASCCPTRRALQTGQFPARHEYHADRKGWTNAYRRQLNVPRMLEAADKRYVTAHFGKWDHRYDEISPAQQGYDFSDGYTGNGTGGSKGSGGPAATPDPKRIDTITDKALHFIARNHHRKQPFYLQLSHYAVHLDIFYNQSTLERIQQRTPGTKHTMPEFAAMTADMDAGIGRILDKLIALKMLENTWLIFLSDNGGRTTIPRAPAAGEALNAPLRDGKHSFYEGGIRVPFMMQWKGTIPAGQIYRHPVISTDLMATFTKSAGAPKPSKTLDSVDLIPFVTGENAQAPHDSLFWRVGAKRAIRMGDWKALLEPTRFGSPDWQLYNLRHDIGEENDLATQQVDVLNSLKERWDSINAQMIDPLFDPRKK